MPDNGPYDSERQARAAALSVIPPEPGWSILRHAQCRQLLDLACEAAGVETGEYDRRILDWISGFEDSACAVFAGLVTRAHEAGKAVAAVERAETEWGVRFKAGGLAEHACGSEGEARAVVASMRQERPEFEAVLITRTPEVPAGPWRPTEEPATGETGEGDG